MTADVVGGSGDGELSKTPDDPSGAGQPPRWRDLGRRFLAPAVSKPLRLVLGLVIGASWLVVIDWHPLLPVMGAAYAKVLAGPCFPVAAAGQFLSLAACAAGLKALSPRLTVFAAFLSRWVRDAVGALPVGLPGLGEAAGVRVLSLLGSPVSESVAVTTADVVAETIAQAIYALIAVALAPMSLRLVHTSIRFPGVEALAIALVGVVAGALAFRSAPALWRKRLTALVAKTGRRLRSLRFAISLALHGAAWVAGGVQIFWLTRILGDPLTVQQALSLEGLVFAARAAAFLVPAGMGVQEVVLAGVGGAYGLAPVDVTALALLFRLRDFAALFPAFPVWFALEARDALRPTARPDGSLRPAHNASIG